MRTETQSLSCDSPLGPLTVVQSADKIVAVEWETKPPNPTPLLEKAIAQLEAYFAGDLLDFDLPLAPDGTDFQKAVWREMLAIPYGQTATYGDVAKQLTSAPRAVGVACGRNPIPIIIPCHRIVGAGGKLTGYSGGDGINTKAILLGLEAERDSPTFQMTG